MKKNQPSAISEYPVLTPEVIRAAMMRGWMNSESGGRKKTSTVRKPKNIKALKDIERMVAWIYHSGPEVDTK